MKYWIWSKDLKKILIVGCKGCVTVCNVGGSKEVEILASTLKIARKKEGMPLRWMKRPWNDSAILNTLNSSRTWLRL